MDRIYICAFGTFADIHHILNHKGSLGNSKATKSYRPCSHPILSNYMRSHNKKVLKNKSTVRKVK